MKKIATLLLIVTVFALIFCNCCIKSEELDPRIQEKLDSVKWEYPELKTTYRPQREYEYWNLLNNNNIKLHYDANYFFEYSDAIQKYVHLFYGEELEGYDNFDIYRGIMFSRLDHPELELLNTEGRQGSCEGLYYSTALNIEGTTYNEYLEKVDDINKEVEPLVDKVKAEEDLYEKYRLIYSWIIDNYTYLQTEQDVGVVSLLNDEEFLIGRNNTHTTQNIYSIITKEAICDGMADSFKYICNLCDLECMTILGYIGNISDSLFHAWNIIPYNGRWYLVDTTWGNQYKNFEYFMVENLYCGDRHPVNMGIPLPMYEEVNDNHLTFESNNEPLSEIVSNEKVKISIENENYLINGYADNQIKLIMTLEALMQVLNGKEFSKDIVISIGAKILKIDYYSYNGALIKTLKDINGNHIIFFNNIDDRYVYYINVYIEFEGEVYKVKFIIGGA